MAEITFTNEKLNGNLNDNHTASCEIADILKRSFEITEDHHLTTPMAGGIMRILSNRDTKVVHVDSATQRYITNAFYIQGDDPEEVKDVYDLIFEHYNSKGFQPANYKETDDIRALKSDLDSE